jgi:hypothetical protein
MLPAPTIPIFNFLFISVSSASSRDEPSVTNLVQPNPLHKRKTVPRLMQELDRLQGNPGGLAHTAISGVFMASRRK